MKSKVLNISTASVLMRYEKLIATLVKYGFEDILAHAPFNKFLPQTNRIVPGTTFIKFAQIASNRPDLLPEELILELEKLQDKAPVVPLELIHKALDDQFNRPLNELLDHFEEAPIASASMAQVHRATLKGGKEVVLKIMRPGIRQTIASDGYRQPT